MGWLRIFNRKKSMSLTRARRRMGRILENPETGWCSSETQDEILDLCLAHPCLATERFRGYSSQGASLFKDFSAAPLHFLLDRNASFRTIKAFCEAFPSEAANDDGWRVHSCSSDDTGAKSGLLPLHIACSNRSFGSISKVSYLVSLYPKAVMQRCQKDGKLPIELLVGRRSTMPAECLSLLAAGSPVGRAVLEMALSGPADEIAASVGEILARAAAAHPDFDDELQVRSRDQLGGFQMATLQMILPQLTTLRIDAPWDLPSWTRFMECLQTNTSITGLSIKDRRDSVFSSEPAIDSFLEMATVNTTIQDLEIGGARDDLCSSNMNSRSVVAGVVWMLERGQLQRLSYSFDDFEMDVDYELIIHALKDNTTLRQLSFCTEYVSYLQTLRSLLGVLEKDNLTLTEVAMTGDFTNCTTATRIQFYATLNRLGRAKLRDPQTTTAEFLDIVGKVWEDDLMGYSCSGRLDEIYGLLRESPSALCALLGTCTAADGKDNWATAYRNGSGLDTFPRAAAVLVKEEQAEALPWLRVDSTEETGSDDEMDSPLLKGPLAQPSDYRDEKGWIMSSAEAPATDPEELQDWARFDSLVQGPTAEPWEQFDSSVAWSNAWSGPPNSDSTELRFEHSL